MDGARARSRADVLAGHLGGRCSGCSTPCGGGTMSAAVYREFSGPIRVETVPRPTAEPGGVIVQVRATGVCRSDWHGWKGHDGDIQSHGMPFVPGHELSGVVSEVGAGVTRFKVGDRVAVPFILSCGDCSECVGGHPTTCLSQQQPGFTRWGSFAEYVSLPRADRNLTPLPAEVSFAQAAAIGCRFSTGWRAVVQQGRLQAGESLAVFGCGGLGLSCVMIGHAAGAKVIAVDTSEQALQKAAEVGADVLVNASAGEDRARDAVIAATSGGADVSVDAAGFSATSESAVWCAARRGRVVQVGLPLGGRGPDIPMARVAGYELEIHGSHGCAAADFPALISMVARGKLRPEVLVEREVSLAEGAAAIEAMDRGSRPGVTLVTRF